jgi:hypothetical protein
LFGMCVLLLVEISGKKGIIQAISSFASCSLEELNSVRKPEQPLFWQLYIKCVNLSLHHLGLFSSFDEPLLRLALTFPSSFVFPFSRIFPDPIESPPRRPSELPLKSKRWTLSSLL